ncbi:MAG: hypothetical protein AAFN74_10070 [Myxococcota bacterium]
MSETHDESEDAGGTDDDRRRQKKDRHPVQDLFRRAIEGTFDTVQNSGALPKEALQYLLQQGDRGRRELVKVAAKELGDFLRATDISSEVVKVLTTVQMDMSVSVRFKRNPDGPGVVPSVDINEGGKAVQKKGADRSDERRDSSPDATST